MKTPIFVFTDDLDVFRTSDAVTSYLEPWILENDPIAFDADGRVVKLSVEVIKRGSFLGFIHFNKEKLVIQETDELKPDALKEKLIDYANRLDPKTTKLIAENLQLSDAVQALLSKKGFTA